MTTIDLPSTVLPNPDRGPLVRMMGTPDDISPLSLDACFSLSDDQDASNKTLVTPPPPATLSGVPQTHQPPIAQSTPRVFLRNTPMVHSGAPMDRQELSRNREAHLKATNRDCHSSKKHLPTSPRSDGSAAQNEGGGGVAIKEQRPKERFIMRPIAASPSRKIAQQPPHSHPQQP